MLTKRKRKFDVSRLKCTGIQSELQKKLCELLPALPVDTDTAEHAWTVFRDAVFTAAETALGFCKRKHQDWFDQNDQDILTLIEAKRSAHAAWLSDKNSASKHSHFKQLRRQVQSRTRELKNAWWADKATEVQNHADNKRSKEFYAGLKSIFGPVQCTTALIRNRDGMLLTDKEDILKQWTLHFSTLLNRTSEVTNEALESIQQRPMIPELDAPPNTAEVDAAIKQLQTGKAPGPDGIPAEVFKAGGETLITHLTRMFQVFWVNGQLPQDLRDANIIHLYKNKGDRSSCDNHRGISLLSIAGKILARIMLNRITKHILDDVVSESQCGFRKQRGTVDMVFAIRQLQEKCVEQHQDLHLLFIDLTKAFDTVNRAALWAILSKLGCPPRFVQIIRSFHDGMVTPLTHFQCQMEWSKVACLRQRCSVSSSLRCSLQLSPKLRQESKFTTALMAISSTSAAWSPTPKWLGPLCETSSLQMTAHLRLTPRQTYKSWLTVSPLQQRHSG